MEIIDRAFRLYLQGWSLRKLEKHFGVDHSTFGKLFQHRFGRDYQNIKNFVPIVQEYLKSSSLKPKDKEQIRDWLRSSQLYDLLLSLNVPDKKLYTEGQINNLTSKQCSHRTKDWRFLFEVLEQKD
jgi:hypothetical protein